MVDASIILAPVKSPENKDDKSAKLKSQSSNLDQSMLMP